jgi:hypothetical protein
MNIINVSADIAKEQKPSISPLIFNKHVKEKMILLLLSLSTLQNSHVRGSYCPTYPFSPAFLYLLADQATELCLKEDPKAG